MTFKTHTFLKSLRGRDISPAEFRVLITVLTYANADGTNAHPGNERLAADCRMSQRQVTRCLKALRTAGLLTETYRGRLGRDGNKASTYDVGPKRPTRHSSQVDEGSAYPTFGDNSPAQLPDTGDTPPKVIPGAVAKTQPPRKFEDPWGRATG